MGSLYREKTVNLRRFKKDDFKLAWELLGPYTGRQGVFPEHWIHATRMTIEDLVEGRAWKKELTVAILLTVWIAADEAALHWSRYDEMRKIKKLADKIEGELNRSQVQLRTQGAREIFVDPMTAWMTAQLPDSR